MARIILNKVSWGARTFLSVLCTSVLVLFCSPVLSWVGWEEQFLGSVCRVFLWSTSVRKLLNLTQQWKVGQVHGSEGDSEPLHHRPCFLWLGSLTGLTYLCTELVFSLEFYTYEWWTKQNSFMFFLPSVAFFYSSYFFEMWVYVLQTSLNISTLCLTTGINK